LVEFEKPQEPKSALGEKVKKPRHPKVTLFFLGGKSWCPNTLLNGTQGKQKKKKKKFKIEVFRLKGG